MAEKKKAPQEIKGVLYMCQNCGVPVVQTYGLRQQPPLGGFMETRREITPQGKKPCKSEKSSDGKHFIHGF